MYLAARALPFSLSFSLLFSLPFVGCGGAVAAQEPAVEWLTDFAQAKAAAKETGRDLLLDFTGSDWCPWCVRLRNEVFDAEPFAAAARDRFVLVELDFPRGKELPEATRAQNERLQGEMGVEGYPTIVLADGEGRPYAKTGYRPGGAEKYLEHLAELREVRTRRDQAWTAAAKAEGAERARLLADGLEAVDASLHAHYVGEMEQIVDAAGDGELAKVWRGRLEQARLLP